MKPTIQECEELAEKMLDNMEYKDLCESFVYYKALSLQKHPEDYESLKEFYEVEE